MVLPALSRDTDALVLLARNHALIKLLFSDYDRLAQRQDERERKAEIVGEICLELSIHLQIEEELFYPAVRCAPGCDAATAATTTRSPRCAPASLRTWTKSRRGCSPDCA